MDSGTEPGRGVHQSVTGSVAGPNIQIAGNVHGSIQIAVPHELTWPVHVGAPPRVADCYQVRAESDALDELVGTTVLVGMGGVGKTQMAVRAARRARNDGTDAVIWSSASSRDAVVAAYAEAAARLHIVLQDTSPEAGAVALMNWLATTDRRWLLVLDDLIDPADLRGLWPQTSVTGRLVVTTRRRESTLARDDVRVTELDVYTSEQASSYIAAKLGNRPKLLDGVDELVAKLGRLPLALAQASAYIIDRNITCAAYVGRFEDEHTRLTELFPDNSGLPDDYQATVSATWTLSIELADQLPPAGLARSVLEIGSFLDPHGVPAAVLSSPPVAELLGHELDRTVAASAIEDSIRSLFRLSLVQQDEDGSVSIHRLVQRATRESIPASRLMRVALVAADALTYTWREVEVNSVLVGQLRANALALIEHAFALLWDVECHELVFKAGHSLGEAGLVRSAQAYYERLLPSVAASLGQDHPSVLAIRNEEATWLGESGDVSGAIERFESLLSDEDRIPTLDPELSLGTRSNLAHWRGRAGDLRGAITELEHLLVEQERVLGIDDRTSLITRSNLAALRGEAGDVMRAIEEVEALLADRIRILGPDDPDTLVSRGNLAGLRGEAGDVGRVIVELEALLADRVRILGPTHPDTLTTRNNLAASRGYAGDVTGAIREFERLLDSLVETLGAEHPHTLTSRANLSYWRGEAGDNTGAIAELQEVLAIRTRVQGPRHPATLGARSDLAHVRWTLGDRRGALRELEGVLADRIQVLGSDNPDTLDTRNSIAGFHGELGISSALAEYEELLVDLRRVLGPDHPDTLAARNNLAGYRANIGDLHGALREFEDLAATHVRVLGPDHPKTLSIRASLAGIRSETGEVEQAIRELESLVADRTRVLGARHPDTRSTRGLLRRLWLAAGG